MIWQLFYYQYLGIAYFFFGSKTGNILVLISPIKFKIRIRKRPKSVDESVGWGMVLGIDFHH